MKIVFIAAFLVVFSSCQKEAVSNQEAGVSSTAALGDDKLFEEGKDKEGCTTEEDLEKKLVEASKAPTSLQGISDPGCEVK